MQFFKISLIVLSIVIHPLHGYNSLENLIELYQMIFSVADKEDPMAQVILAALQRTMNDETPHEKKLKYALERQFNATFGVHPTSLNAHLVEIKDSSYDEKMLELQKSFLALSYFIEKIESTYVAHICLLLIAYFNSQSDIMGKYAYHLKCKSKNLQNRLLNSFPTLIKLQETIDSQQTPPHVFLELLSQHMLMLEHNEKVCFAGLCFTDYRGYVTFIGTGVGLALLLHKIYRFLIATFFSRQQANDNDINNGNFPGGDDDDFGNDGPDNGDDGNVPIFPEPQHEVIDFRGSLLQPADDGVLLRRSTRHIFTQNHCQ